ncbi:hypothetical protein C4J81_15085 [Deltaproteobacteria bacterium Smac51]|nr:hypothetical protein C4J81_15085 [Deltaproteobacteria bacterium Smac51]
MSGQPGPSVSLKPKGAVDGGAEQSANAAISRMAVLLQIEERLRQAETKELPFIVVNETRLLMPYRQAVLWRQRGEDSSSPMAVSGLAVPDKNSPYLQWMGRLRRHLQQKWEAEETTAPALPFTAEDLPEDLKSEWADWLPAYGLFVPLPLWPFMAESPSSDGAAPEEAVRPEKPPLFGVLTLFSQNPFTPADLRMLQHLAGAYGHSLSVAFERRRDFLAIISKRAKIIGIALLLIMLFPLRQSVLAPAEVIAEDPWPVRSPLDGVVERIQVAPNAEVKSGDLLLTLDTTELNTRLAVAVKSLDVARVELRQGRQQALGDREAKLRLAYLNGRVEQLEAEKVYVESLLERAAITSPINGVALVDAPEEWAGKPVSLGQRIMTVADPAKVRLEVFLPMDEYIPQKAGDEVLFFPNISPASPQKAVIYQAGYQAQETSQAGLAFRLRADFPPDGDTIRLGVRGSAKVYGTRAPLIYVVLRKPIMKMRQWLGW